MNDVTSEDVDSYLQGSGDPSAPSDDQINSYLGEGGDQDYLPASAAELAKTEATVSPPVGPMADSAGPAIQQALIKAGFGVPGGAPPGTGPAAPVPEWMSRALSAKSPQWMQPYEQAIRQWATSQKLPSIPESAGVPALLADPYNALAEMATPANAALVAGAIAQPEIGAALAAGAIAPGVKPWWQKFKTLPQMTPREGLKFGWETWPLLTSPFMHGAKPGFEPVQGRGVVNIPAPEPVPGQMFRQTGPRGFTILDPELAAQRPKPGAVEEPAPGEPAAAKPAAAPGVVAAGGAWNYKSPAAEEYWNKAADIKSRYHATDDPEEQAAIAQEFQEHLASAEGTGTRLGRWSADPDAPGQFQSPFSIGLDEREAPRLSEGTAAEGARYPITREDFETFIRQRLEELSSKDELTEDEKAEHQMLTDHLIKGGDIHTLAEEYQAQIVEGGKHATREQGPGPVSELEVRPSVGEKASFRGEPEGTPGAQTQEPVSPGEPMAAETQAAPDESGTRGGRIAELQDLIRRERDPDKLNALRQELEDLQKTPDVTAGPAVPKKKRTFRQAVDEYGSSPSTPVATAVMEHGGLMSKTAAKKAGLYERNKDIWDSAPKLHHPTHNKIFRGNTPPDVMASNLYDEGVLKSPDVHELHRALEQESATTRRVAAERRVQEAAAKAAEKAAAKTPEGKQAKAYDRAQAKEKAKGSEGHQVSDLDIGTKIKVGDQMITVKNFDPENLTVDLEDGSRFGVQKVGPGHIIYGELQRPPGEPFKGPTTTAGAPQTGGGELFRPEEIPFKLARQKEQAPRPQKGVTPGQMELTEQRRPPPGGGQLFEEKEMPFNLAGEKPPEGLTKEGEARAKAEAAAEQKKAQGDLFADAQRLKMRAKKEGGFVNPDVLMDVADFGRRIYKQGISYARWAGDMIRHLGEGVSNVLKRVWDSIVGKDFLPHAQERGTVRLPLKWKGAKAGPVVPPRTPPPPEATPPGGHEPELTPGKKPDAAGIAKIYIEQGIASGDLPAGALEIGSGRSPADLQKMGMRFIRAGKDPSKLIADLKKGTMHKETMPVLWAERQRLLAERRDAQRTKGLGHPETVAAEKAELDFLREVRPLAGGVTHDIMAAWQGAKDSDLLTFDGLYSKATELMGYRTMSPAQKTQLVRMARKGEVITRAEKDAIAEHDRVQDRTLPKVKKTPTKGELQGMFDDLFDKINPC